MHLLFKSCSATWTLINEIPAAEANGTSIVAKEKELLYKCVKPRNVLGRQLVKSKGSSLSAAFSSILELLCIYGDI